MEKNKKASDDWTEGLRDGMFLSGFMGLFLYWTKLVEFIEYMIILIITGIIVLLVLKYCQRKLSSRKL